MRFIIGENHTGVDYESLFLIITSYNSNIIGK